MTWILQGANKIKDVIDENGNFLDVETFNNRFPGIGSNRLEYNQIINSIIRFKNKLNIQLNPNSKCQELPKFWNILLAGGSKAIYKLLVHTNQRPPATEKWEETFNEQINWKQVFTKAVKTTSDSQLKWFQLRTINRLIPTNRFLHIRKIKNNPFCTFGCNEEETIVHLFFQCPKVRLFWNKILEWIKLECMNCDNLFFNDQLIVLGIKSNTVTDKVIDLLIIIGKWHIYKCKLQDREPNIEIFKKQFRERYKIEKYTNIEKSQRDLFDKTWLPYRQLVQ